MSPQLKEMPFFEHLEELRSRILQCLVCLIVAALACFGYVDRIFPALVKPVGHVVFTSPSEAFAVYFMLSLCGAVMVSMPFLLFHIWQFVSSGLAAFEKRYVVFFVPLTFLFFLAGCAFGYFVMLPMMLNFFMSFARPYLIPMITASQYMSFLGTLILSCGLVFEFPLAIVLLTKVGIATPAFLIEKRRYAIVLIFILSAILTPSPDCASQILMAIPLLILYEISILFSRITVWMNQKKANPPLKEIQGP